MAGREVSPTRAAATSGSVVPATSLQLSWHDHALHCWGLHADSAEPWRLVEVIGAAGRHLGRDVAATSLSGRIGITVPGFDGTTAVQTLRIGLAVLADPGVVALAAPDSNASASVRWFASIGQLAVATVRAGRVRPMLAIDDDVHIAHWQPVEHHSLDAAFAMLTATMPPVCAVADIATLFEITVDAVARTALSREAWRPPQPRHGRGSEYRAAQATFRALTSAGGTVLYRNDDAPALAELSRLFQHEAERAAGLAVLAAQLRMHVPDDVDGAWRLTLDLVDLDHPDRWCSARDVLAASPLALDVARRSEHLPRLVERLTASATAVADQLSPTTAAAKVFDDDPAAAVELQLDDVEAFLAAAPDALAAIGVRLIGPEQLLRGHAGVRAAASPRPATGDGRFSAGALVSWDATIDDTPIDDAQIERALAAGSSLMHVGGRWVRLDARQLRGTLDRLRRHRDQDAELDVAELLALAATAATQAAAGAAAVSVTAGDDTSWIADLLAGLPDQSLSEAVEPASFVGELRHYQRRGLSWMHFLSGLGLGGCLADDMGLGKTATTLAHLATRPGPHLVVCPLSVVHNWYAEAARFTPHLQVAIHHGNDRARSDGGGLVPVDVVVTTYGLVSRDIDTLAATPWDTVVLDEAQAIKNHLTQAAKAVRQLPAASKFALTGTPVENHLGELWSILDAVNPGLYGSATQFNDRYAKPIQKDGDETATAALRTLTQPFVLRRTKADKTLLPELPDKIEQIAWASLTREQATMYQAVVDQLLADAQAAAGMKRRGLVLAALTRLKQICNHPAHAAGDGSRLAGRSGKLNRFDELVDDLLAVGEHALVFTQFREMGLLLQRHVRERLQVDAPFLHGGVTRTGREAMVTRFQAGEAGPLLIVSLKAGGTGLNLTRASQVIHYDRWWNPAVEDQATDRAWRLGQHQTVLVHKLVCEGTLEERISQLIDDKKQLASSVLGTGEQWLTELSTDDLRALVTLDTRGTT